MTLRVTFTLPDLQRLLSFAHFDVTLVREPCDDAPGDPVTVAALALGELTSTTLPSTHLVSPDPLDNTFAQP
eukprot:5072913-Prymnesium_polylepis.1